MEILKKITKSLRVIGVPAQVGTGHLLNTRQYFTDGTKLLGISPHGEDLWDILGLINDKIL